MPECKHLIPVGSVSVPPLETAALRTSDQQGSAVIMIVSCSLSPWWSRGLWQIRGLSTNYHNIWGAVNDMLGPAPIASGSLEWPQGCARSVKSLSDLGTSWNHDIGFSGSEQMRSCLFLPNFPVFMCAIPGKHRQLLDFTVSDKEPSRASLNV